MTRTHAPRVLFIYGLEGHPNGSKVRMLRAQGLEVFAPDMRMSLWDLKQENGMARQALRDTEAGLVVLGSLGAVVGGVVRGSGWWAGAGVAGAGLWAATRLRKVWEQALANSLRACVEIQRRALQDIKPDIVVGSSWGGAVSAALLAEGAWRGPTILLAPAIQRVAERSGRPDLSALTKALREIAAKQPLVIVHDPTDETIPHAHSVALAADSAVVLRSVSGGGHRLMDFVERGELAEAIWGLC